MINNGWGEAACAFLVGDQERLNFSGKWSPSATEGRRPVCANRLAHDNCWKTDYFLIK
jgi:hypothetical protein